eukprot:3985223-Prorocentrum_lima.AAC.1
MTSSLVGSEMCIRDSVRSEHQELIDKEKYKELKDQFNQEKVKNTELRKTCLLYTSDAADDM